MNTPTLTTRRRPRNPPGPRDRRESGAAPSPPRPGKCGGRKRCQGPEDRLSKTTTSPPGTTWRAAWSSHLTPVFAGRRLSTITPGEIRDYANKQKGGTAHRLVTRTRAGVAVRPRGEGRPVPTRTGQIDRELTALKRMFEDLGDVSTGQTRVPCPTFRSSAENNVRRGASSGSTTWPTVCGLLAAAPGRDRDVRVSDRVADRRRGPAAPVAAREASADSGEVRIWVGRRPRSAAGARVGDDRRPPAAARRRSAPRTSDAPAEGRAHHALGLRPPGGEGAPGAEGRRGGS